MSKAESAVNYFKNGFNCSQSVFTVFSEEAGVDKEVSLKIACGLGAGMGRLMETCGAVSGAYLVLGLKYGKYKKEDDAAREKTYSLVREFDRKFREKMGSTKCRDLLNCDLLTEEGKKYFSDNNLKENVCEKCIIEAVNIAQKML